MPRWTSFALGVIGLALAGCPPPLTPPARQVRVVTIKPFGCTDLGALRGPGDSIDHDAAEDPANTSHSGMRNEAAEMGANYVWVEGSDLLGSTATGHALKCDPNMTKPPDLSAAPAAAPDTEERLRKLKDLFDRGVITKDEYDAQRTAILRSL